MLTVDSEKRANIADICTHWWVNEGYGEVSCLKEAEYLASLTPVRLDLLLSLAPPQGSSSNAATDPCATQDTREAFGPTVEEAIQVPFSMHRYLLV